MGWNLADVRGHARPVASGEPKAKKREDTLRILNPSNRAVFIVTHETNGDRIRLRASIERKSPLHWYLNERYLGESRPDAPLLIDLAPGTHRLTCMTPQGVTDTVDFEVKFPGPDTRVNG